MARRFTFRLDSEGVEALKRDLEALGPAGTQAFDRLKRSSPQLASALDKAGDSADRVRKRIEQAGNRPPAALKALARAGDEASRSMEGLARHSGPIGSFLGALGPWGIAAAAGIGAVSLGLGKAVTAGLEFEKLQHQIQQLLLTTRGASGQTAAGIEEMAQRIARATLASTREVREAAAGLLTFRAIGGEAFERTLVAAQDLGSLGFGSLRSASVMLAKALEDPVRGTSQLREVGVSFSKDQEQVIKKLAETGRTAEAQAKILDIVEGQVAGAGAAQAGGLAGAFDSLGQAVQNFLEIAADRTGVLETLAGGIRGIASAIDAANESLTPEGRVAALEAEIARRQGRIDEMRTPQGEIGFVFAETNVGRQRVAAEQRRIDALRAERDPLARGLARDAEDLEEGRLMAEARAREERERTRLEERKKVFREIADAQARELQLAAMTSEERARQAAGDKAVEQARKRLVDLTEAEARSIRAGAVAAHDAKQAEAERSKFVGDIISDLERGIEADAKRERTLARHIVGLETAATLESLSGVEKEVQRALLEAQAQLYDEQGNKVRDLTDAEKNRIRAAIEQREALEAQAAAGKKAAQDLEREVAQATDRGTKRAADILYEGFEGKIESLGDLLERTLKRATADALAQAVLKPVIIQPIIGAVMGGASSAAAAATSAPAAASAATGGLLGGLGLADLGTAIGGYLAGGLQFVREGIFHASTLLDSTGALGVDLLGGGLMGGALGGLAAKFLGLGSGNVLVDTGLGLAGTIAGTMIGGPVGGAIGSFLGTALGGLFGGGGFRNGPLTEGFTGIGPDGRLRVTGVGAKDADIGAGRQWAQGGVDFINGLLAAGALSGISTPVRFDTKFGRFRTFTGPTPNNADAPAGGFLGEGADAEAVLIDTVRNMVARGFASVESPEVRLAIQNSAARTVEEFAADVDFAAMLSSVELDAETLTQAERALKEINDRFAEMADRAKALGLSAETLEEARARAIESLTEGFDEANRLAVLHLTDPMRAALEELARAQEERLREAEALGADLVLLERRNQLERQRVIEQYGGQDALRGLLTDLTSGTSSSLAPGVVLNNAESRFNALRDAALAGDATARAELPDAIRNLLAASEASFGSSRAFQEREQFVIRTLETLTGNAPDGGNVAAQLEAMGRQQALDGAAMIDVLERVHRELGEVKAALKARESEIVRLMARVG